MAGTAGFIYFEHQDGELCGMHCVNTLLQGSYFTEVDLAMLAQELDEKERQLMLEMGTETTDFLKYMAEDSGNVADSGNYSLQVLEKALSNFQLQVTPLTSAELQGINPIHEQAFICHLRSHWFTIRRIEGKWYNLNSLFDEPQKLGDFYLQAFLDTLRAQGWGIFVVRGNLPIPNRRETNGVGKWINVNDLGRPKAPKIITDRDLEAAIQASLREANNTSHTSHGVPALHFEPPPPHHEVIRDEDDEELQKALEESELQAAMQASLQNR
eukprot:TRINITY_DN8445_c0_g1_i3.p1 TRINITY_DN8445_c0_g1~~TRINITY_DN8445_c0_g1_i3.p1  ORF type:complete len:270 (-),score=63.57 TRINITY_DN8445_c0_g1_i3:110-919(-)